MRLYGVAAESIVDGVGFRAVIFVQGCPHHCPGCHNPGSHDFEGGSEWAMADIEKLFTENELLDGITLSGGEPFCQPLDCVQLARKAHEHGLSVWCYTGYTLEAIMERGGDLLTLLNEVDVLVDGPFILSQRSLEILWRGSKNQRVIDMTLTRKHGRVILLGGDTP